MAVKRISLSVNHHTSAINGDDLTINNFQNRYHENLTKNILKR